MGNGTGAKAGLVGENAAGHTLLHTDEQAADGAAGERCRVERTRNDGLEHIGQALKVQHHNAHGQHDVEQSHKGHQLFAHAANALDAAQQHHGHQHGHCDANHEVQGRKRTAAHHAVLQQSGIDSGNDGIYLCGIAGAKHGQHAKQGIQHSKKLPMLAQAVFNVVHGAAYPFARLAALTVVHRQRDLGKLGAHAKQGRTPHPEHGTRSANGNRACHTGNVAGAHGAGQRGAHRLKGGHGAIGSVFFVEHASNGGLDGVGKFADLQKARANAQEQAYADDAHHGGHAPDELVDRLIDGRDRLDHIFPTSSVKLHFSSRNAGKQTSYSTAVFARCQIKCTKKREVFGKLSLNCLKRFYFTWSSPSSAFKKAQHFPTALRYTG